jgi:bifunctional non-homologous end joining protein LigD
MMFADEIFPAQQVLLVRCWPCGAADTMTHFREIYERGGEGVCFKDRLAIFQRGRAGQHFKLKFWETATCRVADKTLRSDAREDKHSVALELCCDRGDWLPLGFVTIPQGRELPPIGAIVEVRYLYAQPTGLYQPTFLGVRSDAREQDCTLAQLKWQRSDEEIRKCVYAQAA